MTQTINNGTYTIYRDARHAHAIADMLNDDERANDGRFSYKVHNRPSNTFTIAAYDEDNKFLGYM